MSAVYNVIRVIMDSHRKAIMNQCWKHGPVADKVNNLRGSSMLLA